MTTVFRLHTTLIKLMVLTLGAHLQLLAAHLSVLAETTAAIFLLDYTEVPLSRSPIDLTNSTLDLATTSRAPFAAALGNPSFSRSTPIFVRHAIVKLSAPIWGERHSKSVTINMRESGERLARI